MKNNTDKMAWWNNLLFGFPLGWIIMILVVPAVWGLMNLLDSWLGSHHYWTADEIGTAGWLGIWGFVVFLVTVLWRAGIIFNKKGSADTDYGN